MAETLVLSCYELGRSPTGAALPLAWLKRAGREAEGWDLAQGPLPEQAVLAARFVAISTPMHTALRLGVEAARGIRRLNPSARVIFFGLYAYLNAERLLGAEADFVLAGECEEALLRLISELASGGEGTIPGVSRPGRVVPPLLRALGHPAPERSAFAGPGRYAKLRIGKELRLAGVAEASRGCKHTCRHCPLTPVFGGRFFVVPAATVLEDIGRQVEQGAGHISFADPDFLNGPAHALRVVRAMSAKYPKLSFDFTAKIEHLLARRALLPEFARLGCLFVVSAVESLSDVVLGHLKKGHTRAGVFAALRELRAAGIALRPSWVAFTPWTTLADYLDMLDFVEREGLARSVDPVHYAIRLLIPPRSPLAELPAMRPHLLDFEPEEFAYAWRHPDPRMDRLHARVMESVEESGERGEDALAAFARVREMALAESEGRPPQAPQRVIGIHPPAPGLTESWFCCAEPTRRQRACV